MRGTSGRLTVVQVLPALEAGGVERGTLEVARALVEAGHRSIVVSAGGRLARRLVEEGSEHVDWPIGVKSPWTLRWVPRLRRLLARERVDILHARSRMPAWVAWLAWRGMDPARRPRFVTTFHGFYSVGRYSAVMARGERVIAVSEAIRRHVRERYGVPAERVEVIHRGVDPALYPHGYRPPARWLEAWYRDNPHLLDRLVLTIPGRLTRLKGHEAFVELVRRLLLARLDVHGLVAGGHEPRHAGYARELERRAEAAGLRGRITFLGHRDDLREIMAVSNVVLSLSERPESFGRTTLEALSLGVPVVGWNHGGVGELLTAVLPEGRVPPGDMDALANHVARFLRHPPAVPRTHPFTLERMLARTLSLYSELASTGATHLEGAAS